VFAISFLSGLVLQPAVACSHYDTHLAGPFKTFTECADATYQAMIPVMLGAGSYVLLRVGGKCINDALAWRAASESRALHRHAPPLSTLNALSRPAVKFVPLTHTHYLSLTHTLSLSRRALWQEELSKVESSPEVTSGYALNLPTHVTLPRPTSGILCPPHTEKVGSFALHAHPSATPRR
jgi:hypothetical protein